MEITEQGVLQGDLVKVLQDIRDLANELRTDHATSKTNNDDLRNLTLNASLDAPGIAQGTATTAVKTANSTNFRVDGNLKTLAASDDFWSMSGTTITAGNVNKYTMLVSAGGTASIGEGTQAGSAASVTLPELPASQSIFGITQITVAAGGSFVPGTTSLTATSITAVFTDGFDESMLASAPATISASAVTLTK